MPKDRDQVVTLEQYKLQIIRAFTRLFLLILEYLYALTAACT